MPFAPRRILVAVTAAAVASGCIPRNDYDPPPQGGAFLEGQRHFLSGDHESAAKSFQEFVVRNPQSPCVPEVHYWIGVCRLKQGRYLNAEQAFRKCLASGPGDVLTLRAWVGIGDCYRLKYRFDLAAKVYDRALRTGSEEIERDVITYNRALCLLRKGDFAAGTKALQHFLASYRSSQWAAPAREKLKLAGAFHVQTGAFAIRANAEKHADRLKARGFSPRIEESSGNFRVRVGNVSTWQEALAVANRLRSAGFDAICLP